MAAKRRVADGARAGEIALMRIAGIKLTRLVNTTTGQKLLQIVRACPGRKDTAGQDGLHLAACRIGKKRSVRDPYKLGGSLVGWADKVLGE